VTATMGPAEDRVQRLVRLLRERGHRLTLARRALLEELAGAGTHLTADELTERVWRRAGQVHQATIYRSLDALERAGLVEHVHLGHGRAVYHLADDLHQHLVCEACGSVAEAPAGLFSDVQRRLLNSHGFAMRPYHFAVLGRCRDCEAQPGESASTTAVGATPASRPPTSV
jgi:Fur family transcriptional regulator, ferric uptake regulator